MSIYFRLASVLPLLLALTSTAFGQDFRVLKSEYGADNRWLDVTDIVRNLVRGDGLILRVDGATLTDPLPGTLKTLRIRYIYQGRTRTDNFQDLADVRLGDPEGNSRGGGRGGRGGRGAATLSITRAEYGQGTRWLDVTDMLNREIRSGVLRMDINNETMGGDPAPSNPKTLRVQFLYQGQQRTVTIAENAQLNLPDGSSTGNAQNSAALSIVEATYGAQGRRNNVSGLLSNAIRNDRLNLRVTNAAMGGDPYPGPDKELYVRYVYRGREYESTTREGLFVTLPNDGDRPVSSGSNSSGSIFGGNTLTIESATWGSGDRYVDVSRELQSRIRDNRLNVRAENRTFGVNDSVFGGSKELVVRYRDTSGQSRTVRVREGGSLDIP